MATIYLGLGSNIGDRKQNILAAIQEIKDIDIQVQKISAIIETDPVGGPPQEKYLNAVIKADTTFSPQVLLAQVKGIERKMGRVDRGRNAPREIDIDILLYDEISVREPDLTIPHPRLLERSFVTIPLTEIEPHIIKRLKNANI